MSLIILVTWVIEKVITVRTKQKNTYVNVEMLKRLSKFKTAYISFKILERTLKKVNSSRCKEVFP